VTFFINLIMQESKRSLGVTDIRPGERDIFSRYKDYLATISGVLFVVVYASYISSYFAASGERLETLMFITRAMPGFLVLGVVGVIPVFLSKREYNMQVEGILKEMRELTEGTIDRSNQIDIVNFDELGELSMYVNRNVVRYREFADSIQNLVASLTEASLSLATTAQQNSSVSNQQAAAVAEVVSTMEDSDRLGKTAAERAAEVDIKSVKTLLTATEGVRRMDGYLESMESIRKANEGTIEFIKTLNEDINTIWDVVRMINSIANQVKIIAFNAELEASSAGPAGKNFEIVATEIRRLADNTVASTAEIRDKTQLIEQAARNLIESSDSTTKAIQSGWENSRKIQEAFNSVKQSSEDASASAKAINDGIRMQTGGSEQILMTMKQIAHSASDFAESTKMLSETSRRLTDMVAGMRKLSEAQGHGS
jgi:methyl-accepting chemotaxis protein